MLIFPIVTRNLLVIYISLQINYFIQVKYIYIYIIHVYIFF